MIIKIHKPQAHSSNKGSSANAVEYLEKENNDKNFLEQTHFFNQHSDMISGNQTQNMLDRNKGRLSKDETKFYMLTINPSPNELAHIGKSDANLRDFTNAVMDEYAKNFNREYEKGIPLEGKDLVYFAKIENNRTFKYSNKKDRISLEFNKTIKNRISKHQDKAIKNPNYKKEAQAEIKILESQFMRTQAGEIIKEGIPKDGDNRHVHILVHRYDAQQRFKLSPLSNARNTKNLEVGKTGERKKVRAGFDREKFVETTENTFDKMFDYNREYQQSFNYRNAISKGKKIQNNTLMMLQNPAKGTIQITKGMVLKEISKQIKNGTAKKAFGVATTNPKYLPEKALHEVQKQALKAALKTMKLGAYTNPATAATDIVVTAFKTIGKQISLAAGL